MHIVESDKCTFCEVERENIEHLFWYCSRVNDFWKGLERFLKENCPSVNDFTFTKELILFGNNEKNKTYKIFDYIITVAKYFIYKCKFERNKSYFDFIQKTPQGKILHRRVKCKN